MTQASNRINLRLTDLEKRDWVEAAGGARKLSEWIRATCNAAAHNAAGDKDSSEGDAVLLDGPVVAGTSDLLSQESSPLASGQAAVRVARRGEASESGPSVSGGDGETCPRWMHHKVGRYCGSCKTLIRK